MLPRVSNPCRIAVAILGSLAGLEAAAQAPTRSPFMPPKGAGPAAPTQGAPLEFRAYMSNGPETLYRIYDPAKKAGVWVKLNEKNPDFDLVVKQHDEGQKTLTIEHAGRTLTLAEREAKVVSGGNVAHAAPPPPAPVQPANVAPAVTQSVVLNPTPADEQRRLEAVAAEVARRRALREQATQQINQGPQPLNAPAPLPQGANTNQRPSNIRR